MYLIQAREWKILAVTGNDLIHKIWTNMHSFIHCQWQTVVWKMPGRCIFQKGIFESLEYLSNMLQVRTGKRLWVNVLWVLHRYKSKHYIRDEGHICHSVLSVDPNTVPECTAVTSVTSGANTVLPLMDKVSQSQIWYIYTGADITVHCGSELSLPNLQAAESPTRLLTRHVGKWEFLKHSSQYVESLSGLKTFRSPVVSVYL